jgi:hypothetical protein
MNTRIEAITATATIAPTSPNVPKDGPVDATVNAAVELWVPLRVELSVAL